MNRNPVPHQVDMMAKSSESNEAAQAHLRTRLATAEHELAKAEAKIKEQAATIARLTSQLESSEDRVDAARDVAAMAQDVAAMCKSCSACQFAKAQKPSHLPPLHPKEILGPMHTLSIDLIGPFPRGDGGKLYVLTMVDVYSRYSDRYPEHDS